MQKPLFVLQPRQLEKGLFSAYSVRVGVQTVLNINFLPDLLQFIKSQLPPEQLLRLQDYYLQNYLMQLSIGYSGKPELDELAATILSHIRSNNHFWYRRNNKEIIEEEQEMKHHAISSYHQDVTHLKAAFQQQDKMATFVPNYSKKTNTHFCFRLLQAHTQSHAGTKHCLNHIAYIPQFITQLFKKQNLQVELQLGQGQNKQQRQQVIGKEQNQLKKVMKQCIFFMLKHKSTKVTAKQNITSGNPSEQIQQNESEQESEIQEQKSAMNQEQNQMQHQKTVIDEFIEYVETVANMPKFHSSNHMYNLTNNLLLVCQKLTTTYAASKLEKQPNHTFKTHQSKNSINTLEVPEICKEALSNLSERQISQNECQIIIKCFLQLWQAKLKYFQREIESKLKLCKKGWLSTDKEINNVKEGYEEMLLRPEYVELNKFRAMGAGVPWKQQDYKNFLKGLAQYINIPTNNKRIASFMGDKIEPNHVKHVKGVYLTVMKDRMERGECGGGKRGKCLSKSEFIDKDIVAFSMRWFEKSKKIKKKLKRKRRNSSEEEIEEDVDSQY